MFFVLILCGVIGYFGYQFLSKSPIFGPRVKEFVLNVETSLGINTDKGGEKHCAITFVSPIEGAELSSPVDIEVIVDNSQENCRWGVFEGQAGTAQIISKDGVVLGSSQLRTSSDWMTSLPVTYKSSVDVVQTYSGPVRVLIQDENPQDNSLKQKASIPAVLNN